MRRLRKTLTYLLNDNNKLKSTTIKNQSQSQLYSAAYDHLTVLDSGVKQNKIT